MTRLVELGIWTSVATAVLSLPIKFYAGSDIVGTVVPTAITIVCFVFVALRDLGSPSPWTRYDVAAALMLLYGVCHAAYAVAWGVDLWTILQLEWMYFVPFLLYFTARVVLQRRGEVSLLRCVKWFIVLCIVEMVYEYVALKIFQWDYYQAVPWVSVYEARTGGAEIFGRDYLRHPFYVPTLFGTPHSVGFLAAAGASVFYMDATVQRGRLAYVPVALCVFAAVASFSRAATFGLVLVVAGIVLRRRTTRLYQVLAGGMLLLSTLVAANALDLGQTLFVRATVGQTLAFFQPRNDSQLLPTERGSLAENALYATVGAGLGASMPDSVAERAGLTLPTFRGLEFRILNVWFELGLIYFMLWCVIGSVVIRARRSRRAYFLGLALVPFFVSMVHYLEFVKTGVSQIFMVLLAVAVTAVERDRTRARQARVTDSATHA